MTYRCDICHHEADDPVAQANGFLCPRTCPGKLIQNQASGNDASAAVLMQQLYVFRLQTTGCHAQAAGQNEEAGRCFEESLQRVRSLVKSEPDRADLQRHLSVSLDFVGYWAFGVGETEEARRCFKESLQIVRTLVKAEPHRADLQRDLWASLGLVGGLAMEPGRTEEAQLYLEESLQIMRAMVKAEPYRADLYQPLAASLYFLGNLARILGRSVEARHYVDESVQVLSAHSGLELHFHEPQRNQQGSLFESGKSPLSEGQAEEPREVFKDRLEVVRALVMTRPDGTDFDADHRVSPEKEAGLAMDAGPAVKLRLPHETSRGDLNRWSSQGLLRRVDELELSIRSLQELKRADIRFIGELVQRKAESLSKEGFGRKSRIEIEELLNDMGLGLGMSLDGFPGRQELEGLE